MATYGPSTPGTLANVGSGGNWGVGTNNLTVSDNAYVIANTTGTTRLLAATNFGFSIPSTETIVGLEAAMEVSLNSTGTSSFDELFFTKDGSTAVTTNFIGSPIIPTTSDVVHTLGGATSLGGAAFTYSEVNASTFGVLIRGTRVVGSNPRIDYLTVKIYTTSASTPISGTDTQTAAITETVITVAVVIEATDTHTLAITETNETSAGYLALDEPTLGTTDELSVLATYETTDTDVLGVSDDVLDNTVAHAINDTSTVVEVAAVQQEVGLSLIDDNNVVSTENTSIGAYATLVDTQAIIAEEQQTLDILLAVKYASDTQQVAATQTVITLENLNQQQFQVIDGGRVTATEAVRDRTVSHRPDIRSVDSIEAAYLLLMRTVTDTGTVASNEVKVTQGVRTDDQSTLALLDTLTLFRNIQLADTNMLIGEDTVELDVIYRDSMVLLQMLQRQATTVGFSRIGRGW